MTLTPPNEFAAKALKAREIHGGLLENATKVDITTPEELATYYTPGVGYVAQVISEDTEKARTLTIKKDTIAMISDGTAVLGLGNAGPESVLPILEGKALIMKQFSGINSSPIVLSTTDTEEIIETVQRISPGFGGIFLEDISAPRCFEIEDRLSDMLDIPVFHDDQHGTAIVVLGALINALKLVEVAAADAKVIINGAGAAGIAVAKLLRAYGVGTITVLDSKGIISTDRDVPAYKADFATPTPGLLADAMVGAHVAIGLSKPGVFTPEMIQSMAPNPVVFALANPIPEIYPDEAKAAGAAVVATGRSDFPNQINNALVFPGLFRGLLDSGATKITPQMKIKAAQALAKLVESPNPTNVLPGVFTPGLADIIAQSVQA